MLDYQMGDVLLQKSKRTFPYKTNDLGAQQRKSFKKDFTKLNEAKADVKIFFLTERKTFEVMKKLKYRPYFEDITVVLLTSVDESF